MDRCLARGVVSHIEGLSAAESDRLANVRFVRWLGSSYVRPGGGGKGKNRDAIGVLRFIHKGVNGNTRRLYYFAELAALDPSL